jgi:hypothetical protein
LCGADLVAGLATKIAVESRTAIKGKAILSGKWIERQEVGAPGEYDALSDEELERQIMERVARLGLTDVGETLQIGPPPSDQSS